MDDKPLKPSTRLLRTGRPHRGWVNTPVTRASTYLYDNIAHWRETRAERETRRMPSYGARGNDTTHALEDALVELEGGHRAQLFPTGQAGIAVVLAGLLAPGDHVLVSDAVYEPVRRFCAGQLERLGVGVEFYAGDGSDLAGRVRSETRLIYAETPGSLTFDMMDMRQAAEIARAAGCLLAADNTWGAGLLYRPLDLGADLSIIAATKYLSGHADVMMGAVVANERAWPAVQKAAIEFGQTVSADDAYLVLRGVRTLGARLVMHAANASTVVSWLQRHPAVERVISPTLPEHPGHALWKRDCRGANGLMTVEFRSTVSPEAVEAAIDRLRLFGIGVSWGGFESLALPANVAAVRTVADWSGRGPMVRLHIGLEDPRDLIDDLDQAFAALTA